MADVGADQIVPITFALVGAQKAATSTMYRMLTKHPHVIGGPEKEMRFFTRDRLDWANPDYSTYARPVDRPNGRVAGDATPSYTVWPHALERMRRYNPQMRLILSLRDPIERAMSAWSMERARDPEFPSVPDAVDRFIADRLPAMLPSEVSPWEYHRRSLFIRGLYGQQLERGFEQFEPEQWLVVEMGSWLSEPNATLNKVTDFIGVRRFRRYPASVHRNRTSNDHTGAAPTAADIGRLVDLYAEDLRLLRSLSTVDTSRWPTSRVISGELSLTDFTGRLCQKLGLHPS